MRSVAERVEASIHATDSCPHTTSAQQLGRGAASSRIGFRTAHTAVCRRIAPTRKLVVLVGRMSVPEALDAKFNEAYNNERSALCSRIPGYIRARRFQAVMGEPKYTTVHEMTSLDVWKSKAWARQHRP